MAASRTFKDAVAATQAALVHSDASGNDIPLYKPVYGADAAAPTHITRSVGLPIVGQRTVGAPTTSKVANATASVTTTGNSVAMGTGGSALPGTYLATADPENTGLVVLGDTGANAASRGAGSTLYTQGVPLQAGQAYIIDTDDLRSWRMAVRIANDGVTLTKVGS